MATKSDHSRLIIPGLGGIYDGLGSLAYPFLRFCFGAFFVPHGWSKIIGGAGAWIREWLLSPRNLSGKDAHVIDVYVRPAYRRRGIARDLMQTLVDWCEAQGGIPTATLEASDQGRPLYESLGFEAMNMMRKRF